MARTTTKKKKQATTTRKMEAAAATPVVPRKFNVVEGGKKAQRQGPKPGRETMKKSPRKGRTRVARVPMPPVNAALLPKDFEKMVLDMATSKEGVTRAMLARRGGQTQVAWRPWMQAFAEKHGLEYAVSAGKPVFHLTKARKRA